ncbi:disease resistance protein Roq1-like [Cryptomeria japonica]|uniref:disease resistance protein Roq1-like n=1 Tax=Cryptomeria japonica TaxID=3369 RepID=UPI0027D9D30E|nr:disease resistance protein Roq1-like [Cryptomeria japonica]XP_059064188.1 disease resistance protein Roq1-like [Cryptomeria japonica]XP_059064191.1 disease resistance protein Roq1-like [Cryptomeria japonica]
MASSSSHLQENEEHHALLMASSSSPPQKYAFSGASSSSFYGIEPPHERRKVSESSRLYDVFINHRGPDVKDTLALELYKSLENLEIRAFLDSKEKVLGDSFPSTIETAIHSAAVHIAIFSKGYAESPWCLTELVLMLQSKAKIIPVFYGVAPSALRHIEKGVYAKAFIEYENKKSYIEELEEWKKALQSISFIGGEEFTCNCEKIVSAVQKEVQRMRCLHVAKYPVGLPKLVQHFEKQCIDKRVQDFESQCGIYKQGEGKCKMVGIFGMGGVGKTTLAKELFNRKRSDYSRSCFLFDVREASEQLDALVISDELNKFGNSLVIVTTRDVKVLINAEITVGYNLKGMDRDDAKELFCWHAFSRSYPSGGYEELVDLFLDVCGGLPLSIQVLGRHVHGEDQNFWELELKKVKKMLPQDIQKRLRISIDTLDNEEKQIFMDVACFFIGESKKDAIRVWEGSGWSAQHTLRRLKDKCLVAEMEDHNFIGHFGHPLEYSREEKFFFENA